MEELIEQKTDKISEREDIIYKLEDRPPFWEAFFAALQHVLAIFVGIITPPIIICSSLNLDIKTKSYIISMSLFISGVATFIQVKKFGPLGSGLLSIQGTSFSFLGPIIAAGKAGGLSLIFGLCFVGSFIEMVLSRFLKTAEKIIPKLVCGLVVSLIGMSLIKVGLINCAGGFGCKDFGSLKNFGLAFLVLTIIIGLNRSSNKYLRMGSIFIGLIAGYLISIFMGLVDFTVLKKMDVLCVPKPFVYGFSFDIVAFIPIALIYVVTAIESIGDLTATSMVSGEPIEGDVYMERISGGVLGDGFNSFIAAVFNTFPNTTFSQNNGVIQLTGVASRFVGFFIAGFLVLMGIFPIIGGLFAIMPAPVLGGATILMFGTVAAAGIKIISLCDLNSRALMIIAVSLAMGLGVELAPNVITALTKSIETSMNPLVSGIFKSIFSSGITTGGIFAILTNFLLPENL